MNTITIKRTKKYAIVWNTRSTSAGVNRLYGIGTDKQTLQWTTELKEAWLWPQKKHLVQALKIHIKNEDHITKRLYKDGFIYVDEVWV